ncbi:cell division cycle protein 20 homolog [Calliphora vicina]|uniref:cell division cycle protein 20 homolog n=1 Tax=Calliphora vicina TaxID=7373 RepID=UPI00325AE73C
MGQNTIERDTHLCTITIQRTILVALDLSKAFDTVSHATLFQDILQSIMPHNTKRWIVNYLSGRQSFVEFRDKCSKPRRVKQGVPQGGVLSPLLFNFYLSKLPVPPQNVEVITYVDDCTILATVHNVDELCGLISAQKIKRRKVYGEITRGPAPRWQKKLEASTASLNGSINATRSVLSVSYNTSFSGVNPPTKTPGKNAEGKTKKTPTPNKGSKTPGGGDRFIPNRGTTNFELGHYLIKQEQDKSENDEENESNSNNANKMTPAKAERQKLISDSMQVADGKTTRILSYQNKAPAAPESHINPLKVVYSIKTPISTKSGSRYIPTTSDRILDAPDIINDYYLNLLDWSADNIVTVALGNAVYLWNAVTGNIEQLVEYEEGDHACALAWIQEGQILAIGNNTGAVELWDCSKIKRLRVMDGHSARVGSLAWNSFLVSSGSRDGTIIHHDVRAREHKVANLAGHTQEVCGLKWSTDFKYLASGGNDINPYRVDESIIDHPSNCQTIKFQIVLLI